MNEQRSRLTLSNAAQEFLVEDFFFFLKEQCGNMRPLMEGVKVYFW